MKISFAICSHDEGESLRKLLKSLVEFGPKNSEIIVVDDFSKDSETLNILEKEFNNDISIFTHKLREDFSAHKNFMNAMCMGDYIVNLDADEYLAPDLLMNLEAIIESNESVDLFWVPRVNIVHGITDEHIQKWGWNLTDSPYGPVVNWPDSQSRIYKNSPETEIKWVGKVHERIETKGLYCFLPAEFNFSIIHEKSISRQVSQNEFYSKIMKV